MKKNNNGSIQVRATKIIPVLFIGVVGGLGTLAFSLAAVFQKDLVVTLIGVIGIIICLAGLIAYFIGYGKIYKIRYIEIENDYVKVSKMVGQFEEGTALLQGKMKYQFDKFPIKDICKIGYSEELYGHLLEYHKEPTPNDSIVAEMVFELINGERVTIILDLFTQEKMREFFRIIYEKTQVIPEKSLREDYRFEVPK